MGAVGVLATGCGHLFVPSSAAKPIPASPAAVRPAHHPVVGIDVQAATGYVPATARADGQRLATYIRDGLHAQSMGIVWNLCDPSFTSDTVYRCPQSLSPAGVRAVTGAAERAGLTVQLRPIIRVGSVSLWGHPNHSWEGFINPASQKAWFHALLAAETPYLKLLRGVRGSQFVVGTEPFYTAGSPYWRWLLARAQGVCGCATSVASHDHHYRQGIIPSRQSAGVDWYPHFHLAASASQRAVTAAWEASLAKIPAGLLSRTSLDEESIRATAGAYRHPQSWDIGGRPDALVQARYFTAACQTAAHYRMRAVYFYMIPLNDNPAHPARFPAYFVKNAGAKAIGDCQRILAR